MNNTTTRTLFILLGLILVLCLGLMLLNKTHKTTLVEGFDTTTPSTGTSDPVLEAIESKLASQNPEQLKNTIQALQQRLIDYGYAPQLDSYVKKTELGGDAGKCIVAKAEDRDKYVAKVDLPPVGPRIDLSQYVKKTSIPPEKVCPTVPEIDMSKYVLKSTLPPNQQCPPCIAPKVKVSAGLCRECPPAPTCPPPQPCPVVKCPEPKPCVQKECPKCEEIRYIKVPAVITKTIKDGKSEVTSGIVENRPNLFDRLFSRDTNTRNDAEIKNNDVVKKRLRDDEIARVMSNETAAINQVVPTSPGSCILKNDVPSVTVQGATTQIFVPNPNLNSDFKRFGIYGAPEDSVVLQS